MLTAKWTMALACVAGLLVAGMVFAAEPAGADEGFKPMFNGKDLTGWEGPAGLWEVRDGMIVSESTPEKPCKKSHYLYWKGGTPGDFEMRCKWRTTGDANTGVQFRSETRPDWDTWGYQADIDAAGAYVGCIYQHSRGLVANRGERVKFDAAGKKTVTKFAESKELLNLVKKGDWNEYRILADGPKMILWINGELMCEADDADPKLALRKGIIALQMHQGPPMKVEFKDLQIKVKE